jgi:hypothetical protein
MDAVDQAAVDQAKNIGGADLNGKPEKAAGTPITMPSLTDCFRGLARHADPPFGS